MTEQLNFPTMGVLHYSVIIQDEWWVTADGRTLMLEEMDRSHLANLEPFLRRYGEEWIRLMWFRAMTRVHFAKGRPVIAHVDGKDYFGDPVYLFSDDHGNMDHAFEQMIDESHDTPFEEFFSALPLIKKIRELLSVSEPD